jgi:hypothetical protein
VRPFALDDFRLCARPAARLIAVLRGQLQLLHHHRRIFQKPRRSGWRVADHCVQFVQHVAVEHRLRRRSAVIVL